MRYAWLRTLTFAVGLALMSVPMETASAENVSIGISTPGMTFGLNIGAPPPLVAVPGLPVYQAPSVPDNYFVYGGYYYLFHGGTWYYSHRYNGPWVALVMHQVPRPILEVPVRYYKKPPSHWKKHGPPPWAAAKGHDYDRGHGKKKGHGKDNDERREGHR